MRRRHLKLNNNKKNVGRRGNGALSAGLPTIDFDGNLVLHQPIHVALIELLVQRSLTLVVDELEVGLRCVHLKFVELLFVFLTNYEELGLLVFLHFILVQLDDLHRILAHGCLRPVRDTPVFLRKGQRALQTTLLSFK